mmetsp:Transcript_14106/g.36207  ORF Transcript_14106/g.36207 Transcript_14106/m.36207 type:complete len:402 (-) Transcript_14106:226-1431(-)
MPGVLAATRRLLAVPRPPLVITPPRVARVSKDERPSSNEGQPIPGEASTRTGSDEPSNADGDNLLGRSERSEGEPLAKQARVPTPYDSHLGSRYYAASPALGPLAAKRKRGKVPQGLARAEPTSYEDGAGAVGSGGSGVADAEHNSCKSSSSAEDRFAAVFKSSGDRTEAENYAEPPAVNQCPNLACQCNRGVASLWLPGETTGAPRYCIKCRRKAVCTAPLSRALARKCVCGRSQPSFGLLGPDGKVPKWCAMCPERPSEAVDVVSKRCLCGRSKPSLGLPGEERRAARWCAHCPTKPSDAVDIVNKRCECRASLPSLGLPGESRKCARWCSQCPSKPPEAVNVINKKCECKRSRPRFALLGSASKDARWCANCPGKPDDAMDIVKRKRMHAAPVAKPAC